MEKIIENDMYLNFVFFLKMSSSRQVRCTAEVGGSIKKDGRSSSL